MVESYGGWGLDMLYSNKYLLGIVSIILLAYGCSKPIPDRQLRATISDRLSAASGMLFVTVSVEKGVAKLTGGVSS